MSSRADGQMTGVNGRQRARIRLCHASRAPDRPAHKTGTGGRGSDGRFTGVNTHLPIATSTTLTMTRANAKSRWQRNVNIPVVRCLYMTGRSSNASDGVRQFALSASRFSMRVLYPGQENPVEGRSQALASTRSLDLQLERVGSAPAIITAPAE